MPLPVRLSHPEKEGMMQVSKARKFPLLIDTSEMEDLFQTLEPFEIFDASRPVEEEAILISKESFLGHYQKYIEGIKKKDLIDETPLRPFFSSVLTCTPEALYAMEVSKGKCLIKPKLPVIQLQRHHFIFSEGFHSGVMGKESITWGIQFSYPQLFLDPKTKQISKVEKNSSFPNTELFDRLAKWVRKNTRPTPFIWEKREKNEPMRLGKKCFDWINNHVGLKAKGLQIKYESTTNPSVVPGK